MGRRAVVAHARSPAPTQESLPDTPLAHNIGPFNPALYLSYTPDRAQVSSRAVHRLRCWQIVTGCPRFPTVDHAADLHPCRRGQT